MADPRYEHFRQAWDVVGDYKFPRVKLMSGEDGVDGGNISPSNPLSVLVSGADAFGRIRVGSPTTLFDSKLIMADDQPLFWDESLTGAGITSTNPTVNKPYIDFTSTLNTAGVFTRQTYRRFNYQPGKSQLIFLTGVLELSGGGTGVECRIGYFDDDNGFFFEEDAGIAGVTVRTSDSGSPVDTTTAQDSWNIDKMDGAGLSGITVDWTKGQIFVFDFQWLSLGRVRFGLEIGGLLYYVHETSMANIDTIPWSATPNLPIRYQLVTTSSSPASSMRCICSAVISEGGTDDIGIVRYRSTEGAGVTTNAENSVFAVVGIRLKTGHLGTTIKLLKAAIQVQTSAEYLEWVVVFNPTVAGTFTYSDLANSSVQTALGATANTVTGGTQIGGDYIETGGGAAGGGSSADALDNALILGSAIDGTVDAIVLCVRPIGGVSAATVEGSLTWREIS